jgi:molybdate-binding protein/DNA-binding transcriptional regulator YhcF (GntR family)
MTKLFLYLQIADSVRQEILDGALPAGERLPSVRELAERWGCTLGTVQRAYDTLIEQGLLVSRPGQGTHVAAAPPIEQAEPLRRAKLVHRAESFLLEVLTAGYTQAEVEQAVRLALDRWRTLNQTSAHWPAHILRFAGSHDPAVALLTGLFAEVAPDYTLQLTFCGSLGGLMALAEGQAEVAGTHLWDADSDSYNLAYVRRLLPERRVALLTLAHRRLGLAISPQFANPVTGLADLTTPGLRFVNRQHGAGTRVWLDCRLRQLDIDPDRISGYTHEVQTHSAAARTIAENEADAGLLVESAALAYRLSFIPLTTERYDLAVLAESWERPPVQALAQWLGTDLARQKIAALGGYDVTETGQVQWINP